MNKKKNNITQLVRELIKTLINAASVKTRFLSDLFLLECSHQIIRSHVMALMFNLTQYQITNCIRQDAQDLGFSRHRLQVPPL